MKLDLKDILLVILIAMLAWNNFFKKEEVAEPQPITVTLPESFGSTGNQTIERYVPYPVYNQNTKEQYNVDSEWKKKYEDAKDSIERMNLYNEAIKIRKYNDTLVDNDEITIKGDVTTRGSLLDYTVDYNIKEKELQYTPEIITKHPNFSLGLGLEAGIPTIPNTNFLMKSNLVITNKKGNQINLGYDTDNRAWIGYTFNIFKTKK